jgi:hypothetical protein
MSENELLSVATHLYVHLRRSANRVIDVVWMQRNPEYAREVLQVARGIRDPEVQSLADRLEAVITGTPHTRTPTGNPAAPRFPLNPDVTSRYRGALR